MLEAIFLISINILFFIIMKFIYGINPWEIKKMVKLWYKRF